MNNYWQLIKKYPQYLLFGFLHFFFSSIGQTFLIGLYVDSIAAQYHISTLAFSSIYALATLIGSFLLPYGGRLIDQHKIRTLSWINGLSLSFFGILLTLGHNKIWLLVALIGVRFSGQGYMLLLGSTAISRFFVKQRGKAISISGLGLTAGEGLLPLFILEIMTFQSWQFSLWILCGAVLILHIPLVKLLITKKDAFQKAASSMILNDKENVDAPIKNISNGSRYQFLTQPSFYVANLLMIFIPFAITGMFINHNQLVLHKGWNMELIAFGFTLYALVKVLVSIFFGEVIDRVSAVQLMPYFLLPFGVAFLALALGEATWVVFIYMGLTAVSASLFSLLKSVIWAELYPPDILGTVKGVTHFLIILSTAAAPVVFNQLMISKESAANAYLVFAISIVLLSIAAFWLASRIKQGKY